MVHKELGKPRLIVERGDHRRLGYRSYLAVAERTHRGGSEGLASETPFAEKLSFPKYADHGFLAVLGCDSGLYPPFLDEVDGIRSFTLDKNVLIFFHILRW
jgi:hypothetical protein